MNDPLIEMLQAELREEEAKKKAAETGLQTASQTEVQTRTQTGVETANTAQKQRKTAKTASVEKMQKQDSNNVSNNLETSPKNDSKNEENKEFIEELDEELPEYDEEGNEGYSDEDDNYIKESPDPLLDMVYEPGDTTVEEQVEKSTGASTKSLETLASLGEMVLDYLDNSKAQLCAAISGKEAALFASDQKAKKALIEATKTYVQEIGLKPPTPTQTFLLAVGMWLLPSFGLAGFERFKLITNKKKEKVVPPAPAAPAPSAPVEQVSDKQEPIENTPAEEAPSQIAYQGTEIDYTKCKEYEGKRRLFDRHAKGTYRHLSDGTYANVDLATEFPSAEVLELLEAGKTNAEIRAVLYDE
jgi:hypothetical protein